MQSVLTYRPAQCQVCAHVVCSDKERRSTCGGVANGSESCLLTAETKCRRPPVAVLVHLGLRLLKDGSIIELLDGVTMLEVVARASQQLIVTA